MLLHMWSAFAADRAVAFKTDVAKVIARVACWVLQISNTARPNSLTTDA